MSFVLSEVIVNGRNYSTLAKLPDDTNNITLVTGANGTGKTRLLSGLASQFSGRFRSTGSPAMDGQGKPGMWSLDAPTRTIAQTFSPFSRFPAERTRALTLEEYLRPPPEKYVAIGFTRSAGLKKSASKDAVSRIARKLYTQPKQAEPLATALISLGFEPKLRIDYYRSPVGPNLNFQQLDASKLKTAVEEFLTELADKSRKSGEELRIAKEIASQPRTELATKLFDAIKALQPSLLSNSDKRQRPIFSIDLPLLNDTPLPRNELEGAIILARLGLLRVSDCILWTTPGGRWGRETRGDRLATELSIVEATRVRHQPS